MNKTLNIIGYTLIVLTILFSFGGLWFQHGTIIFLKMVGSLTLCVGWVLLIAWLITRK